MPPRIQAGRPSRLSTSNGVETKARSGTGICRQPAIHAPGTGGTAARAGVGPRPTGVPVSGAARSRTSRLAASATADTDARRARPPPARSSSLRRGRVSARVAAGRGALAVEPERRAESQSLGGRAVAEDERRRPSHRARRPRVESPRQPRQPPRSRTRQRGSASRLRAQWSRGPSRRSRATPSGRSTHPTATRRGWLVRRPVVSSSITRPHATRSSAIALGQVLGRGHGRPTDPFGPVSKRRSSAGRVDAAAMLARRRGEDARAGRPRSP